MEDLKKESVVNTRKMLQLAERNNPVLIALSERWAKETKTENPVCLAKDYRKFIIWVFSFTALFITFAALSVFELLGDHRVGYWLNYAGACFISGMVGIIGAQVLERGSWKHSKRFIKALSLIEGLAEDTWAYQDPEFKRLARLSEQVLLTPAAWQVVRVEQIPWRKKETEKNKKRFEELLSLLQTLLPVIRDRSHYFNKR